jgi:hypothetical protein
MKTIEAVMTEEELRKSYLKAATLYGWMQYHTHDSRRSAAGFPDDVLVNPDRGRVVYVEAKSANGKVMPEQTAWHDALAMCGQEVYVVHPDDLEEITEILSLGHVPNIPERCRYNCAVVSL